MGAAIIAHQLAIILLIFCKEKARLQPHPEGGCGAASNRDPCTISSLSVWNHRSGGVSIGTVRDPDPRTNTQLPARPARRPGPGSSSPISQWRGQSSRRRLRCEAGDYWHRGSMFRSANVRPDRPATAVLGSAPRAPTLSLTSFTSGQRTPSHMHYSNNQPRIMAT
jgi:hypothetical protein